MTWLNSSLHVLSFATVGSNIENLHVSASIPTDVESISSQSIIRK